MEDGGLEFEVWSFYRIWVAGVEGFGGLRFFLFGVWGLGFLCQEGFISIAKESPETNHSNRLEFIQPGAGSQHGFGASGFGDNPENGSSRFNSGEYW